MSDLRDFNSAGSEPVFETNFARPAHVDYLSERIDLSGEGIEHSDIRPLGENSEMGAFRTVEPDEESTSGKLIAAAAVALILGGAGVAGYMSSMKSTTSAPAIAASAPAPKVAENTPPAPMFSESASMQEAKPESVTPAPEPAPPAEPTPKSTPAIRTARVDVTPKPDVSPVVPEAQPSPAIGQQQAAATLTVPEPVSPTPPASSMAAITPAAPVITPETPVQPDQTVPEQAAPQDQQQAQNQALPQATPEAAPLDQPTQEQTVPVQPDVQAQPMPEAAQAPQ